jgi:hypothetical protein
MKILSTFIFSFSLIVSNLIAQHTDPEFEKKFDRAEKIFSDVYKDGKDEALTNSRGAYTSLIPVYIELFKQEPDNMNIAFKLGVCYLSSRSERAAAITYFNKAVTAVSADYKGSSDKEKHAPLIAWKFLGDAYHLDYQFDKAIDAYGKFINVMADNKQTDKVLLSATNRKIEMCKTGKSLVANPVTVKIENLGKAVNSPYGDYSMVLSADQNTLIFTSRRPESTGGQQDEEGNYMEDIYMSDKTKTGWSKATNIGASINSEWHEATVGISPDGQMILIYKDDNGDGNIYSTILNGDVWSAPVKLNENINTKYWEPSAFISADGSTLYFTSDKPGGFGGRDLYASKLTPLGDWGPAVNGIEYQYAI